MEDKITLFLCSDCSKSFSKGMDYNRHRKTHYKPFSCTLCERAFSLKTDLARHRMTHQLRQQKFLFKCTFPECKFNGTSRKDYLWKHMQKKHRSPDMKNSETTLRKYYNEALSGERLPEASRSARNLELLEASSQGDEAKVKDLILAGVDVSTRDRYERTAGYIAVEKGFANLLKILIDAGINMRGEGYCSPLLQEAAKKGDIEIIKMLLDNGADLHEEPRWGGIALMEAAQAGKVASAETLLEYGALTVKMTRGELGFIYACGHVDVIRVIIAHQYRTRWRDMDSGATALHLVAISSHTELIKEVIEMGFDVNEKDYTGKTPLTYALGNHPSRWCMFKEYNKEAADLLLDAGADIGLVDPGYVQRNHPELFAKYFDQRPHAIEPLGEDVSKELETADRRINWWGRVM